MTDRDDAPTRSGALAAAAEPARERMPSRCSVASVHFVIMGCGRVGSTLARTLGRGGHDVAIIDADASAFPAVSSGDNSNILAARVARETFGVEHVAARIYDPQRAMVYQRLGIPTVATVRWTADQMIQRLLPQGAVPELTDPSGKIVIAEVPMAEPWIGRRLTDVEEQTGARVAYVTRLGEGSLPRADMMIQQGDLVHLAVPRDDLARVERLCDQAPAAH